MHLMFADSMTNGECAVLCVAFICAAFIAWINR